MTDNTKLLSVIHDLSVRADAASDLLQTWIDLTQLPGVMRVELVEIQSLIKLQSHLIRRQTEHSLEVDDKLAEIMKRFNNKEEESGGVQGQ